MSIRSNLFPLAIAGAAGVTLLGAAGLVWASDSQLGSNTEGIDVSTANSDTNGSTQSASSTEESTDDTGESTTELDMVQAGALALREVDADAVYEIETEDGGWEVDVVTASTSETHEVDLAADGEVLGVETESADSEELDKAQREVDLAEAVEIAVAELDGTATEAELDHEDGRLLWEVEMDAATDREIDIDATSGEVLERDD